MTHDSGPAPITLYREVYRKQDQPNKQDPGTTAVYYVEQTPQPKDAKSDNIHEYSEKSIGSGGYGKVFRGARLLLTGTPAPTPPAETTSIKVIPQIQTMSLRGSSEEARLHLKQDNASRLLRNEMGISEQVVNFWQKHDPQKLRYFLNPQLKFDDAIIFDSPHTLTSDLTEVVFNHYDHNTLPKLMEVFAGYTEALSAVHQAGFLHRDVKSSNFLLPKDGQVSKESPKIIDFGLSFHKKQARFEKYHLAGTKHYMPPEFSDPFAQEYLYSEATDTFGLAVIFFDFLTSGMEQPDLTPQLFTGLHPAHLAHLSRLLYPDFNFRTDISQLTTFERLKFELKKFTITKKLRQDFETFFKKAFHKNPKKRFQTPQDLFAALTDIVNHYSLGA